MVESIYFMKDQGTSQFDYSLAVNIASESVSAHKNQSTEHYRNHEVHFNSD